MSGVTHPVVEIREPGQPPWRLLVRDRVVVGRAGGDVDVSDPEVSRRHLLLRNSSGRLAAEDLGSTNGTTVNGQRLSSETLLRPGDVLELGGVTISVVVAASIDGGGTSAAG